MTLIFDLKNFKKYMQFEQNKICSNKVHPLNVPIKQYDVYISYDIWYNANKDIIENIVGDFIGNLDQYCIPEYEIIYNERQIEKEFAQLLFEYSSSARRSNVKYYKTD